MSDYPRMLLVREDIIREAEERIGIRFVNKTKCADDLEDLKQQIRTDAIEKFYNKIKNHLSDVENAIVEQRNSVSFISKSEILIGMQMSIEDFLGWLSDNIEQLKEKNENDRMDSMQGTNAEKQ